MKKQIFSLLLIVALMMGCKSAPPDVEVDWMNGTSTSSQRNETSRANNNALAPSSIEGNEWKLIEVYIDGRDTRFNRSTLPEELSNFFTLNLDGEIINGVGSPNLYSAPYTISNNQIKILLIRSTMMASLFQPENITEHDFFNYMQNAYEWKLVNEKLELHSKTESGSEVKLVFSL